MFYHFKIHRECGGYWAECIELPGCITQGESKEELFENMKEALNVYIQEPNNSTEIAPLPKKNLETMRSIVKVPVEPEIAFAFLVRYSRLKKGITQKEAANCLGMKNLYSYQRLERKCNASLSMINKLMQLFPRFPLQKVFNLP